MHVYMFIKLLHIHAHVVYTRMRKYVNRCVYVVGLHDWREVRNVDNEGPQHPKGCLMKLQVGVQGA